MAEPSTIVRSLGVQREGEARIFEEPARPAADGEFIADTLYSGLSAGTELTFFKGTNPYLHGRWDPELGVFRDGTPSQAYPIRTMGYMEVARVSTTTTATVRTGETLAMRYGHKSRHVADPRRDLFIALPEDADPLLGIFVAQM